MEARRGRNSHSEVRCEARERDLAQPGDARLDYSSQTYDSGWWEQNHNATGRKTMQGYLRFGATLCYSMELGFAVRTIGLLRISPDAAMDRQPVQRTRHSALYGSCGLRSVRLVASRVSSRPSALGLSRHPFHWQRSAPAFDARYSDRIRHLSGDLRHSVVAWATTRNQHGASLRLQNTSADCCHGGLPATSSTYRGRSSFPAFSAFTVPIQSKWPDCDDCSHRHSRLLLLPTPRGLSASNDLLSTVRTRLCLCASTDFLRWPGTSDQPTRLRYRLRIGLRSSSRTHSNVTQVGPTTK